MMHDRQFIEDAMHPNLDEFKSNLRMTSDDLREELESKLYAAIEGAEHVIGRRIALSRFSYSGDFSNRLKLESPVIAIESVKIDGAVVPDDAYAVVNGALVFPEGTTGASLTVVYQAGMRSVPFDIRNAILARATALFNNPSDSVQTVATKFDRMLLPYRRWGLKDGE